MHANSRLIVFSSCRRVQAKQEEKKAAHARAKADRAAKTKIAEHPGLKSKVAVLEKELGSLTKKVADNIKTHSDQSKVGLLAAAYGSALFFSLL